MSEFERNKGTLTKVITDNYEDYCKEVITHKLACYDTFLEHLFDDAVNYGHAIISGVLYKFDEDYIPDDPEYCNVTINKDGSIDFDSYHYNGGACWTELVESELDRALKSKLTKKGERDE